MNETKKYFSRFGLIYLAGTIIVTLFQYASVWVLYKAWPNLAENYSISIAAQLLPAYFIAYPIFAFLILKFLRQSRPEKHQIKPGQFGICIIMGFGIIYVCNLVGTYISMLISEITGIESLNVVLELSSNTNLTVQLIIMVLLAPIVEELFFRKLLVDSIVRYGEWVAIFTSGLFFGLLHGNITQFAYTFPLGMFLAYIYIRTGKIQYTIAIHMCINFVGGVVSSLIMKYSHVMELLESVNSKDYAAIYRFAENNMVPILIYFVYILLIYGVMIAGLVLLGINKKKFFLVERENEIPKGERFKAALVNPGVIAFIVAWLAYFLVFTFMEARLQTLMQGMMG